MSQVSEGMDLERRKTQTWALALETAYCVTGAVLGVLCTNTAWGACVSGGGCL